MKTVALFACLFVARVAAAGELTSAGPTGIRAPDNLVLGRDATATVRVRDAKGLHLVTSAGTLSELVADGADWRATLTLPAERYPQRAIVAAVDDEGTVRDWLAIPFAGQARVKVDTEPRASVIVRVGTVDFGPVVADAKGVANVEILVPPGVPQATTVATGKKGAIRDKPMQLGVAPFARTLTVCAPSGDHVSVVAVLATGAPSPTAPKVSASTGMTDAPVATGNGVFVSKHHAAPATDTAELAASFTGEDSVRSSCTLRVPPAAPSAIRIAADRASFVAGSGAVTLTLALDFPAARRLMVVDTIALSSDVGTISAPQRTDDVWSATWTLPDRFDGRPAAHVTASIDVPNGAPVTATMQVPLVAGTATRIEVSAPQRVRADGATGGSVEARVYDRFGNFVRSPQLKSRSRGRVGSFATNNDGIAASYVAPRTRDPGDDIIEVVDPVSGLTGRATIQLDALPRRFALSLRGGYLSNLGRVATPVATFAADARVPLLEEHLTLGFQVSGYAKTVTAMDGTESVTGRITTVPVLARVGYRRTLGPIDAWGGVGAGVALTGSEVSSASAGMQREASTRLAATAFVGGAKQVGPGWIVVEAGYLHATLSSDASLNGRVGGILATAGFAYELR